MNWTKKSVRDPGGFWTDHISDNGQFIIAQGYDEWERLQGRSWALFDCSKESSWKNLGYFMDAEEAKVKVTSLVEEEETTVLEQKAS